MVVDVVAVVTVVVEEIVVQGESLARGLKLLSM